MLSNNSPYLRSGPSNVVQGFPSALFNLPFPQFALVVFVKRERRIHFLQSLPAFCSDGLHAGRDKNEVTVGMNAHRNIDLFEFLLYAIPSLNCCANRSVRFIRLDA